MVVGGIPNYLAQIDKGLSSVQVIERLAFSKNSFLLVEFDKLYSSFRNAPIAGSKEQGAQIALLFDRDDDSITICEIKYTNQPFVVDKQYAKDLTNKVEVFKKKTRTAKQIFIAMISANGVKPTMYSEELISGYVTLDNIFSGKKLE